MRSFKPFTISKMPPKRKTKKGSVTKLTPKSAFKKRHLQEISDDAPIPDFGTDILLRIGANGMDFRISKALLCDKSPYFKAMFSGNFAKGEVQGATLQPIEGVVSVQSLSTLLHYLESGSLVFDKEKNLQPEEEITVAVEMARFADLCGIEELAPVIAEHIRKIIIRNSRSIKVEDWHHCHELGEGRFHNNTRVVELEYVRNAVLLPDRNEVRKLFAKAAVEGVLRCDKPKFSVEEMKAVPEYMADVFESTLHCVHIELFTNEARMVSFLDPIGTIEDEEEEVNKDEEDDYSEDWGLLIGDNYRPDTPSLSVS